MNKQQILDIIDRRISEQYAIIKKYKSGSAYNRAQAIKTELIDLKIEVEKIRRQFRPL